MATARWLLVGGALLLLGSGCSSNDESTASTTTTSVGVEETTTSTTEAEERTSTSVGSAAEQISTIEDEASAAVLDGAAAYRDCLATLRECMPESVFAVNSSGEKLENLIAAVASLQERGLEVRVPADPDLAREFVVSVDVNDEQDEATVTWCQVDGSTLLDPGAGPEGEDVVVVEGVGSLLSESLVRLEEDGVWRSYQSRALQEWEGADGCTG